MSDDQTEFLQGRVLPTRQAIHLDYPADSDDPSLAVVFESTDGGAALVVMPTATPAVMHFEMHAFVDGQRVKPEVETHVDGSIELMLRADGQTM